MGFLPLFPPPGMGFMHPGWRPAYGSPFSSANLIRASRMGMPFGMMRFGMMRSRF